MIIKPYTHLAVSSVTCIRPMTPVESILEATFTVLPQMSYCGFWAPTTPAITGPWLRPGINKINSY